MTGFLLLALALLAAPPESSPEAPRFDPEALPEAVNGVEDPRSDLQLEPRRDGAYVYRDADAQFRAVIHRDGSVEYLPPPRDVHLTLFGFDLLHRGRTEPDRRTRSDRDPAPVRGTADPTHDPNSYGPMPILIGFGGRVPGPADLVQRSRSFAAKARFLDDTAQLRRELARQADERHTRERLGSLEAELNEIWSGRARSPAGRRAQLFERWDECAEASVPDSDPSEEDAHRAAAGERGRRQIEAFVRRNVPADGPMAYSHTELERLNAGRQSRRRFDPYASAIEPGHRDEPRSQ